MSLDRYDKLILAALQKDGRISNVQLAQQVNLSESACLRRVRALEESGLIDRYVALLSQNAAGLPGNVFVQIGLHREVESDLAAFEDAVREIPEVMECYLMTGAARPPGGAVPRRYQTMSSASATLLDGASTHTTSGRISRS